MAHVFVAAQLLAFLWLLVRRDRYRWFLASLLTSGAQAANVVYWHGTTVEWTATWWFYPEILVLLLAAAATFEAVRAERGEGIGSVQLQTAAIGIPGAIVAIGWLWIAPPTGDILDSFIAGRAWLWAFLALSLGVTVGLVALRGLRRPSIHSCLLLAVLADHALVAPFMAADQPEMRVIYRCVIVAACIIWSVTAGRRQSPAAVAPPAEAPSVRAYRGGGTRGTTWPRYHPQRPSV